MEKLIITVAPVGAEVTRREQPYLPVTPEEIAKEAVAAREAGAAIIHLHVRDEAGKPTQDVNTFARVMELIKSQTDLIIQVSTGGAVGMTAEERLQPLALKPEMASLTGGTCNFGDEVFYNPPPLLEAFARRMLESGVKPEIEVFEAGMIQNALALVKKGLLKPPLHFDFVLGVPGAAPATPRQLLYLAESLPAGATWSVAGVGRHQLPLATLAIILGGHARVGFEDNIYYRKGELAQSNARLVARVVRLAGELGRPPAAPDEARRILGLAPRQ
ncbi:3-keto-5-aminohexanoate cleavage protein [Desulfotomaculum copahuensis]|uniref:3-keto-5-aminohexanoate cleavage protein n=1 Tax=Desulfotomaculum copahuensis TaxID=1838280 RepID=A0A1B7LCH9_9FIRM|nr:3-keto-5-aminohexanoate cleavage protein [Desulfotomaculum copahuensis]OAT80670.1 3-keto-5-aminohexanoate cleavage protein [Desulfotomaculum copahuensis]